MSQQQTIVGVLERGRGLLAMHLADFSEADMLARSSPSANHAAYQIGHLLRTTAPTVAAFDSSYKPAMPPKTEGDAKAPPTSDDPAAFASKDELLSAWEAMVDAMIAAVRPMTDGDFDRPAPDAFKRMAATLGQLALMLPLHMSMHVGQIQAIRRKLGKPVLF
jgi:hypothetical protein